MLNTEICNVLKENILREWSHHDTKFAFTFLKIDFWWNYSAVKWLGTFCLKSVCPSGCLSATLYICSLTMPAVFDLYKAQCSYLICEAQCLYFICIFFGLRWTHLTLTVTIWPQQVRSIFVCFTNHFVSLVTHSSAEKVIFSLYWQIQMLEILFLFSSLWVIAACIHILKYDDFYIALVTWIGTIVYRFISWKSRTWYNFYTLIYSVIIFHICIYEFFYILLSST